MRKNRTPTDGEVAIYHTDHLNMPGEQFIAAAHGLIEELKKRYCKLTFGIHKFIVHMPSLL